MRRRSFIAGVGAVAMQSRAVPSFMTKMLPAVSAPPGVEPLTFFLHNKDHLPGKCLALLDRELAKFRTDISSSSLRQSFGWGSPPDHFRRLDGFVRSYVFQITPYYVRSRFPSDLLKQQYEWLANANPADYPTWNQDLSNAQNFLRQDSAEGVRARKFLGGEGLDEYLSKDFKEILDTLRTWQGLLEGTFDDPISPTHGKIIVVREKQRVDVALGIEASSSTPVDNAWLGLKIETVALDRYGVRLNRFPLTEALKQFLDSYQESLLFQAGNRHRSARFPMYTSLRVSGLAKPSERHLKLMTDNQQQIARVLDALAYSPYKEYSGMGSTVAEIRPFPSYPTDILTYDFSELPKLAPSLRHVPKGYEDQNRTAEQIAHKKEKSGVSLTKNANGVYVLSHNGMAAQENLAIRVLYSVFTEVACCIQDDTCPEQIYLAPNSMREINRLDRWMRYFSKKIG